ncbi:uncharacterized protein [Pempheris klunzingeri]|uniref:uncharacterized protein n=1 Tax=Pempheris klunzingeri TaxID=3127111 RepID=UPI0039808667
MSADDFQMKYASVMESMLGTAVAETTKLFETMVDELKAEISRVRKENEDLKTRCGRLEKALCGPTVYTGEREPLPVRSGASDTCDRAVQCDLVPFHTVVVERCQPLGDLPLQDQEQQCSYHETESSLQDHNYENHVQGNSQMAFIVVKQESVLKQEEDESGIVYGRVLSADTAGTFINQACSYGEIPLPQRHGETQVALELQCLGMDSSLQGAQNQSSELEHPLVISLASRKEDSEEESNVGLKISDIESQGELITPRQHPVEVAQHQPEVVPLEKEQPSVLLQECQRESETLLNNVFLAQAMQLNKGKACDELKTGMADGEASSQPYLAARRRRGRPPLNKGEACDESKNGVAEGDASSQSDLPVKRRRGRPPKKVKCSSQPMKETLKSPSSDIPTEQGLKNSCTVRVEEVEVSLAVDTVNTTSSESPQAAPVQPEESPSIITLSFQERANSAVEDVGSSKACSLAVSVASLTRSCHSEKGKQSECQQLSMDMEDGSIQALSTEASTDIETLDTPAQSAQALLVHPREFRTSVPLRDAMLLVEAMNQSVVVNTFSSPLRMAAPQQTQFPSCVGTLQTQEGQHTPLLPVETHEASGILTEVATATQSTIEKLNSAPQATDATSIPSAIISSMPLSTAAIQTSALVPITTLVAESNAIPEKIIVVPRSVSSLIPHKIAAQCPTQVPTDAIQSNSILQGSTSAGLSLETYPLSSGHQKTVYVVSRKLPPVVTSHTATSTDSQPPLMTL